VAASGGGRGGSVNDGVEAKFVATSELGRFTGVEWSYWSSGTAASAGVGLQHRAAAAMAAAARGWRAGRRGRFYMRPGASVGDEE
jgi:hypothetical protein